MKNEILSFVFGFVSCVLCVIAFKFADFRKDLLDNGDRADDAGAGLADCKERTDRASEAVEHGIGIIEEVRKREQE